MSTLPWVTAVLGLSDMLMSFHLEQTIYHYTYPEKQSYWSGVVAQPVISALEAEAGGLHQVWGHLDLQYFQGQPKLDETQYQKRKLLNVWRDGSAFEG